jgi:hypothetical protein
MFRLSAFKEGLIKWIDEEGKVLQQYMFLCLVKPKTIKLVFVASLLSTQH